MKKIRKGTKVKKNKKSEKEQGKTNALDISKNHENNKYTLELVNSWINNADTKISISCGISSFVFAIIMFGAENYLSKVDTSKGMNDCILTWFYIMIILAGITFLLSLWYYFFALNPSLIGGKASKGCAQYSIFYEDIKEFSTPEEYIKYAEKASDEDFNQEIMREVFYNSKICSKKMHRFRMGMWFSVLAIVFVIGGSFLYYISINK